MQTTVNNRKNKSRSVLIFFACGFIAYVRFSVCFSSVDAFACQVFARVALLSCPPKLCVGHRCARVFVKINSRTGRSV